MPFSRWFIIIGIIFIIIGLITSVLPKWLPFGRLPGDIVWEQGNFRFYFPLASSLLLSLILTLLLQLFFRR